MDRRPRPGTSRRRPDDDTSIDEEREQPRRDPRRRTAYVPRQDAPEPRTPSRRSGSTRNRQPTRQRPQQPPYRAPAPEPDDYIDAYDDPYADDQVLEGQPAYAPPRQRRPERQAPRRPRREPARQDPYGEPGYDPAYEDDYAYDEGYDDSFIDEDDWYEEEAAAGAYAPPRQRAPRQPRSVPRPNIRLSKPNIPRPVMPSRVKDAALVQDQPALVLLGALVLSAIAMALLTMNRVDTLAPGFATHVSASGIREAFRSETALWQLPLMAGALLLMNAVLAWFLARFSSFSSRFVLGTTVIVHAVIWVALFRIAF